VLTVTLLQRWVHGGMGWGMGYGWGWGMIVFWLLILALVAVLVWGVLRVPRRGYPYEERPDREDRAEAILRERYARDEIDDDTYRRKLDELRRR
jgi:putative membrane protein